MRVKYFLSHDIFAHMDPQLGTHLKFCLHGLSVIILVWFILIYFSSIVKQVIFCLTKSRSNPFLETTSTKQLEKSFLLKETMGAFDGAQTHDYIKSLYIKSLH